MLLYAYCLCVGLIPGRFGIFTFYFFHFLGLACACILYVNHVKRVNMLCFGDLVGVATETEKDASFCQ